MYSSNKFGASDSTLALPMASKHKAVNIGTGHDTIEMSPYNKEGSSPKSSGRQSSFGDLMHGIKDYEHYDSRKAAEEHLAFADGDIPDTKVARLYHYLLNASIITRWILFIIPVLAILWIPGIVQLTRFHTARLAGILLFWWSIWFSIVWGGWWACLAASRILPVIIRSTVGLVAVSSRRYIDWLSNIHRYVALFLWTLVIWITWNPIIDNNQLPGPDPNSNSTNSGERTSEEQVRNIDFVGRLLFGFLLCAGLLLFEKFGIQWVATKFHEKSYAERIAEQKFAVRSLVILYRNSIEIPGRSDTLSSHTAHKKDASRLFRKVFKGARDVAKTTTTALGNVASEIAGTSVLQPNSPAAVVQTALESANKSRLLARRLFYSFAQSGSDYMYAADVGRFFSSMDMADKVFAIFDRDGNGDASREEVEMAVTELHREQLSLEHSMQNLDSAVGRLDNILMSLYVVVAAVIIAVVLEAAVATLLTGAGTLVLGLSWLIGDSMSEVLVSIIFLFVKHPYDVGDRVDVVVEGEPKQYTVKEIRLLSTLFLDSRGVAVQAPNVELNKSFIQNLRRSGQYSEPFTFEVTYDTSFEDLEHLRDRMMLFLKRERRDFLPVFDVEVVDYPNQESMMLSASICYKSNAQQSSLKARRRNMWLCALKRALGECGIYGPGGNPDEVPDPKRVTQVPWDVVREADRKKEMEEEAKAGKGEAKEEYELTDGNAGILSDADQVFGDDNEMRLTSPRRDLSDSASPFQQTAPYPVAPPGVSGLPYDADSGNESGTGFQYPPPARTRAQDIRFVPAATILAEDMDMHPQRPPQQYQNYDPSRTQRL